MKLFDFGLAKKMGPKSNSSNQLYKLTGGCGSCRFMAPEIARYERYNESCDVYSFSILMWTILTLKTPYVNYNIQEWYQNVVQGKERPGFIDEIEISESMKKLMNQCWDDDIFSRPSFDFIDDELRNKTCAW